MNKYFRPATVEDFNEPTIEIRMGVNLTIEQKEKIAAGEIVKVVNELRKETGMGLVDSKKKVMEYHYFLQAKNDFEAGKPVFVPYNS